MKTEVHSIDPAIDDAAQYALRKIRRERKHAPISKRGVPDISKRGVPEGARCEQGCCEMRSGYWRCIA